MHTLINSQYKNVCLFNADQCTEQNLFVSALKISYCFLLLPFYTNIMWKLNMILFLTISEILFYHKLTYPMIPFSIISTVKFMQIVYCPPAITIDSLNELYKCMP